MEKLLFAMLAIVVVLCFGYLGYTADSLDEECKEKCSIDCSEMNMNYDLDFRGRECWCRNQTEAIRIW